MMMIKFKKENETKQISRKKESKQNQKKYTQTLRHITFHIQKPIKTKSEKQLYTFPYKEKTYKVEKYIKHCAKKIKSSKMPLSSFCVGHLLLSNGGYV